ncbi:MAG TPA: hypothetical protein VGR52_00835 [Stellaceae bacterium]|nr:hypothetical protein [Stellaceae bacterium]
MKNEHVLGGLIRKRKEIAGQIEDAQLKLRQAIIDLDNLDCAIRLFDPEIDLEEIRPSPLPPRHSAYKGEMSRIILGALRDAGRPMTSKELVFQVMAERGLAVHDKRLVLLLTKRVGASLKHYKHKGTLRATKGIGPYLLWEISR